VGAIVLKDPALTAVQLLWVNLIMDSLASLALATEPPTDILLERKPYPFTQPLVSGKMARFILGHAFYQCVFAFLLIFKGDTAFDLESGRLGDQEHLQCYYDTCYDTPWRVVGYDSGDIVRDIHCENMSREFECSLDLMDGQGTLATEACCSCGGGHPGVGECNDFEVGGSQWKSQGGLTCGDFSDDACSPPDYDDCVPEGEAISNYIFDENGYTAMEACCALGGGKILDEENRREPTPHYTMVFNSFVMMQAANIVNARMLHGERNVFSGLFKNRIFVGILVGIVFIQILLIQFGGVVMNVTQLSLNEWLVCVVIGLLELLWHQVILFIPIDNMGFGGLDKASEPGEKPLLSRKNSQCWRDRAGSRYNKSLSRANSNTAFGKESEKFLVQQSGKELVKK